jgi:hypothetical protein
MKYCTHCGAENNDNANFCSKCGNALAASIAGAPASSGPTQTAPMPTLPPPKKLNGCLQGFLVLIAIFVGLVILCVILAPSSNNTTNSDTSSAVVSPSSDNTASSDTSNEQEQSQPTVTHSHGFTIIGGLGYRIDSLSHPAMISSLGDEKSPAGEFVVLRLSVTNVGTKGADISNSDFHLKSGERQFDADNGVTGNGAFFLEKINPGTTKSGVVVFDVPANTSPHEYSLKVYGNGAEGSQTSTLIPL